jgi:hypothetical protein
MTSINLYEAYAAVYDENLREDLMVVEEDFDFIDELSDIELDQVMEEILSEGIELSECFEALDEVLSEARVDMAARAAARKQYAQASEKSAKEARGRAAAKEKSERRAERVQRIKSSAKRAAEKVKTTAAGVASAAAAGAAEAGRAAKGAASAAKKKVTGKLAAAKERIKSAVKSGRSAVAGGLRKAASKIEPKETEKKVEKKSEPKDRSISDSQSRRIAAAQKLAKAASGTGPSGTVQKGQPAGTFKSKKSRAEAQKREARLSANESFELLDLMVQDMIEEGYVNDVYEAYDLIQEMDINETSDLVESYLTEEVEGRDDLFDYILEYLVAEGYADTNENALVIMTNMSEEWRESIVEESMPPRRSKEERSKRAKELGDRQTIRNVVGKYNKEKPSSKQENPDKYYSNN